uniref:Uncharacterized protein n=1 Tax=Leviviridae sp. TaxID=2027243 RepID=A0A142D843_9VIRU|nr:hypothetical protein [Leviviridae sp.]
MLESNTLRTSTATYSIRTSVSDDMTISYRAEKDLICMFKVISALEGTLPTSYMLRYLMYFILRVHARWSMVLSTTKPWAHRTNLMLAQTSYLLDSRESYLHSRTKSRFNMTLHMFCVMHIEMFVIL